MERVTRACNIKLREDWRKMPELRVKISVYGPTECCEDGEELSMEIFANWK